MDPIPPAAHTSIGVSINGGHNAEDVKLAELIANIATAHTSDGVKLVALDAIAKLAGRPINLSNMNISMSASEKAKRK
jgi:hypothetical protein